jgi:hypothetical protein
VLCRYGFAIRGLHRLQIETLTDNHAMIAAATRAGFVREGTLRRAAWVDGCFADEAIFGLLVTEWTPPPHEPPRLPPPPLTAAPRTPLAELSAAPPP